MRPSGDQMGPRGDQVGPKWGPSGNQVGPSGDQVIFWIGGLGAYWKNPARIKKLNFFESEVSALNGKTPARINKLRFFESEVAALNGKTAARIGLGIPHAFSAGNAPDPPVDTV